MDILSLLRSVLAIVETGALLMALVFLTRSMKEKKEKGKASPERKANYIKSGLFILVYMVLNMVRNFGLLG